MSLKPWLSRRVPGIAKSTLAKLRRAGSPDLAVDELPPLSADDLAFRSVGQLRHKARDCHPDDIPPILAKAPDTNQQFVDIFGADQIDAERYAGDAPERSEEDAVPFPPQEEAAEAGQLTAEPAAAERPIPTEHLAHQPPLIEAAPYDQISTAPPFAEGSAVPSGGMEPITPLQDTLQANGPPRGEQTAPGCSHEGSLPPPPQELIPAAETENRIVPPPPLMPPVDTSTTEVDDTRTEAVRHRRAPKLLSAEERRAYMRAVNLFHSLQSVGNEGRSNAIHRLFDLCVAFPHGSSIRTIVEMLNAGRALHEIEDAAAIKDYWRSDSSLWLRRSMASLEIHSDCRNQTQLSWSAALALSSSLGRDQALDALQGILLHEWLNLSREWISISPYEFSYFHTFVSKRSHEIAEGGINPMLQMFQDTIHDDPVMPTYLWLRSRAPNLSGQPMERVFLPGIQNIDQYSPTFTKQALTKKGLEPGEKDTDDVG